MTVIQNFFCIPRKNIISSIVADLPLIQNYRKLLNFLNQIETLCKGLLLFSHRGYMNMSMWGYFFRFFSKDTKMKLSSTCGLSYYKPDRQQILVLIPFDLDRKQMTDDMFSSSIGRFFLSYI